jgi:hypothetical protein
MTSLFKFLKNCMWGATLNVGVQKMTGNAFHNKRVISAQRDSSGQFCLRIGLVFIFGTRLHIALFSSKIPN